MGVGGVTAEVAVGTVTALIVVGSDGPGTLATARIGGVASRVIRHAPCPCW